MNIMRVVVIQINMIYLRAYGVAQRPSVSLSVVCPASTSSFKRLLQNY